MTDWNATMGEAVAAARANGACEDALIPLSGEAGPFAPHVYSVGDRAFSETYGCDGTVVRIDARGVWFYPDATATAIAAALHSTDRLSPVTAEGSGRASIFYSAASLKGKPVPPREWLVPGMVPSKTVTLFSGDGGTGKSLLALHLSVAVAAATRWIGRSVQQGGALFISAEDDDDELHRRLSDILRAEGRDYDDVAGLTLRSLAGEDALLAMESQIALMKTALFEEMERRAANDAPVLIVIDTLADVYPSDGGSGILAIPCPMSDAASPSVYLLIITVSSSAYRGPVP